ncbi:MAG: hypothetical protein C5B58_15185 [Acidobacteria bacterium]|nr:MAG: hypothetical protein C5B58_15185 [Acidobacteriota bacterium]
MPTNPRWKLSEPGKELLEQAMADYWSAARPPRHLSAKLSAPHHAPGAYPSHFSASRFAFRVGAEHSLPDNRVVAAWSETANSRTARLSGGETRRSPIAVSSARSPRSRWRTANAELQNGEREQVRTDPPNLEDLEHLDQLIDEFFPIALSTEEDFARAIKAAYLVLELIDIHTELLVSVSQTYREFFLP